MKKFYRPRNRGEFLPELPVVLWVLLFFLFIPMLNLGTATVRAYFLRQNVLEAAHRGAKALTLMTPTPVSQDDPQGAPSANDLVNQCMNDFIGSGFGQGGCAYDNDLELWVIRINIATGQETMYGPNQIVPVADIDPAGSTYYLEVRRTGRANPFLTYSGPIFANIPGLTGPMVLQLQGREMFENVGGLSR